VAYLEQRVNGGWPCHSVRIVGGVSGHLRRVHQPVIGGITLVKNHLSSLVKNLRTVVWWLIGLTRAVVNEQVSPNDHEVVVHIGCTAVQCTSQTTGAKNKINMYAVEGDDTCVSIDAFQSHPFGWGLIRFLRVAVNGTGVDE